MKQHSIAWELEGVSPFRALAGGAGAGGLTKEPGRLAGCLMSHREPARGDPGGSQSPSSGLQPDPMPVAPFFPIITVAGSVRKHRAPKCVDMRHFPPSTSGGGGVWTSALTMQKSGGLCIKSD